MLAARFLSRIIQHLLGWIACVSVVLGLIRPGGDAFAAEQPVAAAAADLKFALAEIHTRFKADTGRQLRPVFGSSGNFAHQILHGAPFQIFLSADEAYVHHLAAQGLTRDQGALYAIGRIVLFAPHGEAWLADGGLNDLGVALAEKRIKRFAIANPEHAPYGRAARAALQHAGLWEAIQPLLVFGENAAQATQFAVSGSTQGGLIPLSLALVPRIATLGTSALVPQSAHIQEPLRQRMVLLAGAGQTAELFFAYMQTTPALDILATFGFVPPEEVAE